MNAKPDISGIDRHWREGEDDRVLVQRECGLPRDTIDAVIAAVQKVVAGRRRTKIVGVGVFEWKPWRNRLPTGRVVKSTHLSFKQCRYARRFGR